MHRADHQLPFGATARAAGADAGAIPFFRRSHHVRSSFAPPDHGLDGFPSPLLHPMELYYLSSYRFSDEPVLFQCLGGVGQSLPAARNVSRLVPLLLTWGCRRWPRPDEALATFSTPALARQAVSARANRSTVLVVKLLSDVPIEKRKLYQKSEQGVFIDPCSLSVDLVSSHQLWSIAASCTRSTFFIMFCVLIY